MGLAGETFQTVSPVVGGVAHVLDGPRTGGCKMATSMVMPSTNPSRGNDCADLQCGRRVGPAERCSAPVLVVFNIPSSALMGLPRCAEHAEEMRRKLADFLLPGSYYETPPAQLTQRVR